MSEFRLTLKHPSGFFAVGGEMQDALTLLSDGAFKIYVYVCSTPTVAQPSCAFGWRKWPRRPVTVRAR
jgi:hypothetical protein